MGKEKDIRTNQREEIHIPANREALEKMRDMNIRKVAPEELSDIREVDLGVLSDIREVDPGALSDIREIKIDRPLSDTEKKREFLKQIGNPYLYRQGEYIVKLSFADTDATLTDRLKEYIEHVAAAGL